MKVLLNVFILDNIKLFSFWCVKAKFKHITFGHRSWWTYRPFCLVEHHLICLLLLFVVCFDCKTVVFYSSTHCA